MGYDTAGLLADIGFNLQFATRYTRDIRLDGLNRAIEALVLFASEDYDVREVLNPADPSGKFPFAMEFPLPNDILYLASISFKGIPLRLATQAEFVMTGAEQSLRTATIPEIYYVRSGLFVNVFPRPSAQNKVQIYGLFKPVDLALDTDPIPLTRVYSSALVSYATWWCLQGQTGEGERIARFDAQWRSQAAWAKFNKSQNTKHSVTNVKTPR